MKVWRWTAAAIAALLMAVPAESHHSQVMYDDNKLVTIEGTLTQFRWVNPHTWLFVDVTTQGKVVHWEVETNSAASLVRAGWKRTQFKPNDKLTVTVNPAKNGEPKGMLRKVVGPGGIVFEMPGNTPAAAKPPAR